MAWNEGSQMYERYRELYDSAKTGTFGVANDVKRLKAHVEVILADPVEKVKFCTALAVLVDGITTPEEACELVQEKLEPMSEILVEMVNQYPGIIPEPEEP